MGGCLKYETGMDNRREATRATTPVVDCARLPKRHMRQTDGLGEVVHAVGLNAQSLAEEAVANSKAYRGHSSITHPVVGGFQGRLLFDRFAFVIFLVSCGHARVAKR